MLKIKALSLSVIATSLWLSGCFAGKSSAVDEANKLFAQNQDQQAEAVLKRAAEDDFIDAQVRLAQYYELTAKAKPENREQYMADARLWYQRAIRNGSPAAEYHFGMLDCNEQINDPQLAESCLFWLQSAAQKGSTDAQVELANRYFSEREDPVALLNAQFWAEQAAPKSIAAADLLDKIQFAKIEDMNSVEWIVAQRPQNYTIQLNVFAELYDAIDYAFNWGLEDATIYEDRMGNYSVLTGVFNSEQQAAATINEMPDELTTINTQALSFAQVLEFISPEDIELALKQNAENKQRNSSDTRRQRPRQQRTQQVKQPPPAPAQEQKPAKLKEKAPEQHASPAANPDQDLSDEQQTQIRAERDAYAKILEITQPKAWLAEQQSKDRYSILLLRDVLPTQALRFLELTGVKGAYAHLRKNGTIYILAGAYDTQEAAISQVESLPEAFLQFEPQVISVNQLQ